MAKIHLLPDQVANKIAAGEVIQRPASVVKELLENAIDAGANEIKLVIEKAGKSLIQVIDNGCGMSDVDAVMAFERHATSKIVEAEDLFRLTSFGFRGEAMASIGAVAEVTLLTRPADAELGVKVVVEESEVKKQEAVVTPPGSNVQVRYLFRAFPARRNFLKSDAVESKHNIEQFQRIALARPDIAFSFYQGGQEIYQLPSGKLSARIVDLFGKAYQKKLIPCEEESHLFAVKGYIGKGEHAKKTRGEQFFFMNGRYIKNNYLDHSVKQAFGALLPDRTYPFYVLCIEAPPDQIDLNIHPTKTEVKCQDERLLYALINSVVKKALATYQVTPSIDFEQSDLSAWLSFPAAGQGATSAPTYYSPGKKTAKIHLNELEERNTLPLHFSPTLPSDLVEKNPKEVFVQQLYQTYLITFHQENMVLIDQAAAHERILYERSQKAILEEHHIAQQLIFPVALTWQPAQIALLQACQKELEALGFRFTLQPPSQLILTGHPVSLVNQSPEQLLEGLLDGFAEDLPSDQTATKERWARSFAKKASIRPGKALSSLEMQTLVAQLFSCQCPEQTPDGRTVYRLLPKKALDQWFIG